LTLLNRSRSTKSRAIFFPGSADAEEGVLEAFQDEGSVRESRQVVVQGSLAGPIRRVLEVNTGLGVDEIGGDHVGQRLGDLHGAVVQGSWRGSVQVERT
jgi:hypothetical protein